MSSPGATDDVMDGLPLLAPTPDGWAELAASELPVFLADHAVCEQQAALAALNLVAHYPEDHELVQRMAALAAEEVSHLRRVARLLHARGLTMARRRPNPYVQRLRAPMQHDAEPQLKIDRLLVGALIEARSCERFTRLMRVLEGRDPEVVELLRDLGPAEKRHWEIFYSLAAREAPDETLAPRWSFWCEHDRRLILDSGTSPTVHG